MRLRSRSYERFATYLLLRKLESSAIGDCWRAAPIEGLKLGDPVALRRFPAGDEGVWRPAIEELNTLTPYASAGSVTRGQRAEFVDSTPFLVHRWEGGRPLSVIADRAFSPDGTLMPVPVDLALSVAERIVHSLVVTHGTRHRGLHVVHGAILPSLVWITEEGETRVAGQGLGHALAPAAATSADLRPFLAPEVAAGGAPTAAADVYSAGAILLYLLTGRPSREGVGHAKVAATGQPVPADISRLLEAALAENAAQRSDAPTLHRELTTLINSGGYTATTFNLAYFVQTLLRDDLEAERKERESEARINVATAAPEERHDASSAAAPAILTAPARASATPARRRLGIAAAVVLCAAGAGAAAWYASREGLFGSAGGPGAAVETATAASPPPRTSSPILPAPEAAAPDDSTARAAAFEQEVNRRLREEMAKLQRRFDDEQRQSEASAGTRAAGGSAPMPGASDTSLRQTAREGQLVDLREVDQAPTVLRASAPTYPEGSENQDGDLSVIVTALISETGRVLEARVLRGSDSSLAYDAAAVAAVRNWEFNPALKDGQRVRTWVPVSIDFRALR